ncbi:MAG TPA: aldehyde ferredoxin oxidoreductase C-terminal domain-containing protein, partial [Anaerolineales bacterium]|nr:aldehyde ferredoxin oxidoreductase C-terminal domain-containing protein [Anaerolineales bacterium]
GLDYAAAKSVLNGAQGDFLEMARSLASGQKARVSANGNGPSGIERGPCMAAGFAIYPRLAAGDNQDQKTGDLLNILDSAGLCPFLGAGIELDVIAELLSSATGVAFSQQDLTQIAQRIRPLGR